MKKKLVALIGALMMMTAFSVNAYANGPTIDINSDITILDSDPNPVFEGGIMSRAAKVTDSFVLYGWIHNGNFLQVDGYVTMMDGTQKAYHYTQVKMTHKTSGAVYEQSDKKYGYGEVWAATGLIDPPSAPNNYQGRVFYGTN